MLPGPKTGRLSLADVMPSCLAALSGLPNALGLQPVRTAIVLVADGLGAAALAATAGHARTLSGLLGPASVIDSGFPTTTASALATLMTGVLPGEHGLVGYSVFDSANDRIINQLSGWDDLVEPARWQSAPTVFERARDSGIGSVAIGPERYRDSGFTAAVLRGADYLAAKSIPDRLEFAASRLHAGGADRLIYVYVPELDMAAHAIGWESGAWTDALELVDAAVRELVAGLGSAHGLLVTADHGILDVPARSHILIDAEPGLVDGIRHVAGDPRCLQLHFEPDLSDSLRDALIDRWRASESDRAWVATRDEAIDAGWFGAVAPEVMPRMGDLFVAARKRIVYYDSRVATEQGLAMVGQHGSLSPAELKVPLLRFGAFARASG